MNKKIIILIIAIVVIVTVGCVGFWIINSNNKANSNNSNSTENQSNNEIKEETPNDNAETNDKKVAVIYFSATGTTEKIAGYIKNVTNGDLIEIEPKEKYTSADLNYGNNNSRATREQNDSSARPEIKNNINTDNYEVIYLGYPIWWGDVPKIILTFLDSQNLDGKILIPFCTSGSTGISGSVNTLKNYKKNIIWLDGKRFSASTSLEEINSWVTNLNY